MKKKKNNNRRGAAIVIVLVCFVLIGAIIVSSARRASTERDTARLRDWRAQAEWLAEAAMERAAARADLDAEYAGETWTLEPEQFAGRHGAVVKIAVEPVEGQPEQRRIEVTADYPDDPLDRCRCTKETVIERKESGSAEDDKDNQEEQEETPEENETPEESELDDDTNAN